MCPFARLLCVLIIAVVGGVAEAQRSGTIVVPRPEAIVSDIEEVEGLVSGNAVWPVLFVRPDLAGQPWWTQPPVEEVDSGKFAAQIHFGDKTTPAGTSFQLVLCLARSKEEAATFKAGATSTTLPPGMTATKPLVVFRDKRPAATSQPAPRTINFSGRTWHVKSGSRLGPGPNDFSDSSENVWVDDQGHLHLAITKVDGRWRCAEIVADRSLGFGEYRWIIEGDLSSLDRQVVLGLFTYESANREIDFELSRWGDAAKPNAQFVVQPYTLNGHIHRFDTGKASLLTSSIVWEKSQVRGRCWEGAQPVKQSLTDWMYKGRMIPAPGKERARANLWLFGGKGPSSNRSEEVLIRSFEFRAVEVR